MSGSEVIAIALSRCRRAQATRAAGGSPSGRPRPRRFGHRDSDLLPKRRLASALSLHEHGHHPCATAAGAGNGKGITAHMPIRQQNVLAAKWSPNGDRLGAPGPHRLGQPGVRRERLQPGDPAPAAAQGRLPQALQDARQGRGARHVAGRLGRARDEGVGAGEGRDPLRARLPAADRPDRREARQLLRADRRGHGAGRVLRQGADPGRARRVVVPVRRPALDVRGPRLHRLGSDQPGVHPGEPQRRAAVHPDRVRLLDRRGAGQQDPAAALDGRAVEVGDARAEAVRQRPRPSGSSPASARSRSTS